MLDNHTSLLMVDLQNDFMPGGALGVPDADKIIPLANALQKKFETILATQDWHPKNHTSFKNIWPVHCVQHTHGAALVDTLDTTSIDKIIYKGTDVFIDSYSAFFDNDHKKKTRLDDYLKKKTIDTLYVLGVALEYCVKFSVLDALSLGYRVYVIQDACRSIELNPGDTQQAYEMMQKAGAIFVQTSHLLS